jgi:signal-transduction protein with cAMP-binding, CBS, and nucleotidyltransferase domain
VITLIYKKEERIFEKGEPAKTLIVLKKGNAAAIEENDGVETE